MRDDRLEFYDPLYETITFESGLPTPRPGFRIADDAPINPCEIVQTAEFARLSNLKQAGLAWLVFPSATHTRFAHSIGCWWLGRIAETLIKIKMKGTNETLSLRSWLDSTRLREEFYLGLLLHDIGHGPLSHVLESNPKFIEGLISSGIHPKKVDHENRGASLLLAEEPLISVWRDIVKERFGESIKTFENIKSDFEKQKYKDKVCIDAVCYLMTNNDEYLQMCSHRHREYLPVVKDMISGVLDLDRLDHYARDSYFSGLHQISINLRGLLNNLRIVLPDEDSHNRHLWALTEDGASYAASLLFNKRLLLSTMFCNVKSVSYHVMINWALSCYLNDIIDKDSLGYECLRISMMDDEELLNILGNAHHQGCKMIVQRIRSMAPYKLVDKWSENDIKVNKQTLMHRISEIEQEMNKKNNIPPRILIKYDNGFLENKEGCNKDWFGAEWFCIRDSEKSLINHPDYKSAFYHLRDVERQKYLWVFVDQENIVKETKKAIERAARSM